MNKREIVILQTEEGTAKDINHLKRVWNARIKKSFPHYTLKKAKIEEKK